MNGLYFTGMVYEGVIIFITSVLLCLILFNYLKNRNILILLLFLLILSYFIAIFFSWLSKVLILYSNIDYLYDETIIDPLTSLSWILLRISDFRISFLFLTVGTLFSYVFKVKIFEKSFKKKQKIIIIAYSIFTGFYSLVIYQKGNLILDLLAFFFVFLFMGIVYIPFMKSSIRSYKNSEINNYKKAFFSLAVMSLSFVLILLCFLIDRIYIFLGDFGFTFFYFMGWIFVIIGVIGAYFGYLHLHRKEN
ncbi:MAG: hypothetical protein V3V33_03905 [Candidatus Lokiarchaeia archaeon]